jgi:hypothetical protein
MSQFSMPWPTSTHGDGEHEYTAAQWWSLFGDMFGEGIAPKVGGGLEVSEASSSLSIATGRALIGGVLYVTNVSEEITVPIPSADTGYRIILQRDDAAQTVRLALIVSEAGVTDLPAYSSALSLCGFTMTAGGQVSDFVDERQFLPIQSTITSDDIEGIDLGNLVDNVTIEYGQKLKVKEVRTEEIANKAITYPKVGERNLAIPHRIGNNNATWGWAPANSTDFTPQVIDVTGQQVVQMVGTTGDITVPVPNTLEQIMIPLGVEFLKTPHLMYQLISSNTSEVSAFISIDFPNQTLTARLTRLNDYPHTIHGVIHFILTGPVA